MKFNQFLIQNQKTRIISVNNNILITPLVSVCIQTYNQKNFISECIESVLNQIVNFPFEILIGDDDSTDGTKEICKSYAEKHPDKIKLFLHNKKNKIFIQDQPTGRFNFIFNLFSTKGQYIAICEGDDYWTDPLKLQIQVDFLEQNKDFAICHHRVNQLSLNGDETKWDYTKYTVTNIYDLAEGNHISTPSVVFRKPINFLIPKYFLTSPMGDYPLWFLIAETGKIKFIDRKMGIYRTGTGIWSTKNGPINEYRMLKVIENLIEQYIQNDKIVYKLKHQEGIINLKLANLLKGVDKAKSEHHYHLAKSRSKELNKIIELIDPLIEKPNVSMGSLIKRLIN